MFKREDLHRLVVEIAGPALEREDEQVRRALESNSLYPREGYMGLYWNDNERDYQFLIWKALVNSNFPFRVELEKDKRDFTLFDPTGGAVIGELKRWYTSGGQGQNLDGIKNDIRERLKEFCPGFMLITTVHDAGQAKANFDFLAKELGDLGMKREDFEIYTFPTIRFQANNRKTFQFALIGFIVTEGRSVS